MPTYPRNCSPALCKDFMANHSVYSLSTTDATELGIRLALKRVIVKDHELIVTLGV
jgi:hypothetical protein